jgi:DNA-binding beta-propeller fold protein YncE
MRRLWIAIFAAGPALSGCFPPGDGREPPLDQIYFPVGLALSSGGDRLYVANSDFDLQYNAGTLMALDAERIRTMMPTECEVDSDCGAGRRCDNQSDDAQTASFWCVAEDATQPCGAFGEKSSATRALEPGRCNFATLTQVADGGRDILLDTVVISAFATDSVYRRAPQGGGRVFVPVRGDATLHWADVEDEQGGIANGLYRDGYGRRRHIDCGQGSASDCDDAHRAGDDSVERSVAGDALPVEPYGVAVSDDGEAVVTTHQTTGQLALFVNDWCDPSSGPKLTSVLSGLSTRPIAITPLPIPQRYLQSDPQACGSTVAAGARYQPSFLVSYRFSPMVQLIRYFNAEDAAPGEALLEAGDAAQVSIVPGFDTRGIAVDGSQRQQCESACGDQACNDECASLPLQVYLANRFPAGLLSGATSASEGDFPRNDLPNLDEVEPLRGSPSRVVIGHVIGDDGQPSLRVFVVTFDTRFVYIYDPKVDQIEARVYTGRGPHALAVDGQHGVGYVAHFTDSYVGVIDLDRRHRSYGQIVLTLGQPRAPRASK